MALAGGNGKKLQRDLTRDIEDHVSRHIFARRSRTPEGTGLILSLLQVAVTWIVAASSRASCLAVSEELLRGCRPSQPAVATASPTLSLCLGYGTDCAYPSPCMRLSLRATVPVD